MTRFGYFLLCEEHGPRALVEQATLAEQAGFDALWISDHFHPWNHAQGESPFVWSVIGAIAQACDLPVTTAVTCPTVRTHPAIVAQAAATSAVMLGDRFVLGVGTGEALNEHITGEPWPPAAIRLEMLREAVEVIRRLWTGEVVTHRGTYFQLDQAQIYTTPTSPPPVYVSGFGPDSIRAAAEIGDGYITTSPDPEPLARFRELSSGPAQAGTKVCWAPTADEGVEIAHRLWGTSGVPGELAQVLPTPQHFEQAGELVTTEQTRKAVTCGNDVDAHVAKLQEFVDAGFDEVYVANIGPHYREMIAAYGEQVLPRLRAG
ncbi:TIGR03557 family F420-dependent LLM class oxidoreductase [Nocardioides sp. Bht2]|uniref:TIGR03557 family F420-dependent LLM class oxidoreductase n=1 Tax=Nocardioides sp. Bht2 TaxID=3392297 RepID=UPI0039B4232F